jgi:hypothetical protein
VKTLVKTELLPFILVITDFPYGKLVKTMMFNILYYYKWVKVSCFPKWAVLNLNMGISVKE